jgi:hypothetical protein
MRILLKDDFDLLLAFIVKEKRFLKIRETSFSEKQLKEGKNYIKDALAAAKRAYPKKLELEDALMSPTKRQRVASAVAKKCKRFLSRKQAKTIVENFVVFSSIFNKQTPLKRIVELDPTKEDRFYAPHKHEYR